MPKDRYRAVQWVFQYYRRVAQAMDEDGPGLDVTGENAVWTHVHMRAVYVLQRLYAAKMFMSRLQAAVTGTGSMGCKSFFGKERLLSVSAAGTGT